MTKTDLTKPTRVERSRERLDAAVNRLEAALDARAGANGAEAETIANELKSELEGALKDRDALKTANTDLGARLDGAILRIRAVLEA